MSASSRDAILSRIRRAVGARSSDEARQTAVAERLATAPRGIVPARGQLEPAARIDLLCDMAEKANSSVTRIASYEALPEAVAGWLRDNNLPAAVRMGDDPRLAAAPFPNTALTVSHGPSDGSELTGLSHAIAGVAETGTLVLVSGNANPTSLNFLPENHIVVVAGGDVVGDMESVWSRVREQYGKGSMPRSLNFITGPSRSADIEQTLLLGAHGPRALHVIVVG